MTNSIFLRYCTFNARTYKMLQDTIALFFNLFKYFQCASIDVVCYSIEKK